MVHTVDDGGGALAGHARPAKEAQLAQHADGAGFSYSV